MRKVLFVDDEAEIIRLYESSVLTKPGQSNYLKELASGLFDDLPGTNESINDLNVTTFKANQGQDAVEIVQDQMKKNSPIQVAFIDMRMPPGIDGKETAKRIRQIDPHIEIVFVTAFSDTRPEKLIEELGTPEKIIYLKKPFDTSEIKQLVLNLTTKYRNERIKEEFVNNITHELKTPLSSILGFSELLLSETPKNQKQYEYISILYANTILMKTLVNDLIQTLEFSKKRPELNMQSTDIKNFIEEVYLSLKVCNTNTEIDFRLKTLDEAVFFDIDQIRLKQVLYNLIINSFKFTERGHVDLILEKIDQQYLLTISDTGIGIQKEHQDIIFEKFERLENEHHNRPGFGLGLYLVKSILELHELKFKIDSAPNKGTSFTIYLN